MFISYLKKASILFLVLALILSIAYFIVPQYCTEAYLLILAYFFLVTIITHFLFMKSIKKEPKKFTQTFMLFNGIKIALYLAFLILALAFFAKDVLSFLPVFIFLYICFSIFETRSLSKLAKKMHKDSNAK